MSTCPTCKTPMKPLFTGMYCPRDCDLTARARGAGNLDPLGLPPVAEGRVRLFCAYQGPDDNTSSDWGTEDYGALVAYVRDRNAGYKISYMDIPSTAERRTQSHSSGFRYEKLRNYYGVKPLPGAEF